MRVLIINNHTKHLDALATLFLNADIIDKNDLREDINYSSYDLVVISGGSGIPTVLDYPDEYNFESKLITETSRPVLGICLGSEIITYAFGGILQKLEMTHKGIIELDILDKNLKKILGSNFINVHESHKIGIKQIPKNFIVCATSEHGVEIIKHKTKPILGIQFHPEISKNDKLFKWIFETLNLEYTNFINPIDPN